MVNMHPWLPWGIADASQVGWGLRISSVDQTLSLAKGRTQPQAMPAAGEPTGHVTGKPRRI